jgi:hypothetical protein
MKHHSKIIESLLSGQSLDEIAQSIRVKPATLHSLFLDPSFRQALDAAFAALDAELLSLALHQLRSLLLRGTKPGEVPSSQDPKILLSAIETVLKRDLNLLDKRPLISDGTQTVVWKWADEPVPPPAASNEP